MQSVADLHGAEAAVKELQERLATELEAADGQQNSSDSTEVPPDILDLAGWGHGHARRPSATRYGEYTPAAMRGAKS